MVIQNVLVVQLIIYLLILTVFDIKTHRIPNLLSSAAAVIGLILQFMQHQYSGLLSALLGAGAGLAIFLPMYLLRALGAGDVKALAVVGIYLGARGVVIAALATLLSGALIASVYLLRNSSSLTELFCKISWLVTGSMGDVINDIRSPQPKRLSKRNNLFPYGLAITTGTYLSLWYLQLIPFY